MKKRISNTILVIAMMLFLLPQNVAAAEGDSWQFGTVEYYSTFDIENTITDGYAYTDDWFFEDSSVRNDALALVSMQLTAAAVDSDPAGLGVAFLKELGFSETGFEDNGTDNPENSNYTWGRKSISSDGGSVTLVAVNIQSYSFDNALKETAWKQNFTVNGEEIGDEHDAFQKAADAVVDEIASLAGSGDTKFWISGQSRGGALANLIAKKLANRGIAAEDIFAYTFEAPAVVEADAASESPFIHNYICSDDPVTRVPPWGMERHGNTYPLKTEETDAKLLEELEKLGSSMVELFEMEPSLDVESRINEIIDVLTTRIPTRADYSAPQEDEIKGKDGQTKAITYTYQDKFIELMELIFGGSGGRMPTDTIAENLGKLRPAIEALVQAVGDPSTVEDDSDQDYYDAAVELKAFLEFCEVSLPLDEEDLYVILKLAGPAMVNTEYEPYDEKDYLGYLGPLMQTVSDSQYLTASHQFDTIIARLKVLAPLPELEDLNIEIEEPAAGDAGEKAPAEVMAYIDSLDEDWLSVTAKWSEGEDPLEDDQVHYLDVEIRAVAHLVPEDFSVKLNGEEPVKEPEVSYRDGVSTVRASWAFTLGTPKKCEVSFDAGGHADDPESVTVDKGTRLGYAIAAPDFGSVKDDEGRWAFVTWETEDGTDWKDVTVKDDLTLVAKWKKLIEKVEVKFTVPRVGDTLEAPVVPADADYILDEVEFLNSEYEKTTVAENEETMHLYFVFRPKSDQYDFWLEPDEWGDFNYLGEAFINGEVLEVNYDSGGLYIRVDYWFNALPKEEENDKKEDDKKEDGGKEDEKKDDEGDESPDEEKNESGNQDNEKKDDEKKDDEKKEKEPLTPSKTDKGKGGKPGTGDASKPALWMLLFAGAGSAAGIAARKRKKLRK